MLSRAFRPASSPAASTQPIPVVHLVDTLYVGGTERQLIEHLRVLDRRRFRPIVASLHTEGPLVGMLRDLDVPHRPMPLKKSIAHPNTAVQVARLARLLVEEQAGVLHAHDFYSNVIGVLAAKLARRRVIASRRDLAHWLSPAQRRALAFACRAADRVVCNARLLGDKAVEELGVARENVLVVPNGIDLQAFDAERAQPVAGELPFTPGDDRLTVGVVSSMHLPDKGQADLICAASMLAERGRKLRLVFVGDGAERPKLEAEAKARGVEAHFLGRRSDVPRILARVEAACLPSWAEGFPNAVMEAMAAALPVVATTVGGCPELVDDGNTGWLVPPKRPDALADALDKVAGDAAAAKRMGQAARRTIEERYDLRVSSAAFERLYRALVGAPDEEAAPERTGGAS